MPTWMVLLQISTLIYNYQPDIGSNSIRAVNCVTTSSARVGSCMLLMQATN